MSQALIPLDIIRAIKQCTNIYELRILAYVIAKAQSVLKLYDRNLADINMQYALDVAEVRIPTRRLVTDGAHNYKLVEQGFGLARKVIHYKRDNAEGLLNIISNPMLYKQGRESYIKFYIAREFWTQLLDFVKGYRLINLSCFLTLRSTYAAIMYVLVSQQTKPMTYSLATLHSYMGTEDTDSYKRGYNYTRRVIEAAKTELDEHCPWSFTYEVQRDGRGGKIVGYTIYPTTNRLYKTTTDPTTEATIERLRARLDDRVIDYLKTAWDMTQQEIEVVEPLLEQLGKWHTQIDVLARTYHTAKVRQVDNPKGYLVQTLRKMV